MIVLGIVAVLVLAGGAVYFVRRRNIAKSKPSAETSAAWQKQK